MELNYIFPFAYREEAELKKCFYGQLIDHLVMARPWTDEDTALIASALDEEIDNILNQSTEPERIRVKIKECLSKHRNELINRVKRYKGKTKDD